MLSAALGSHARVARLACAFVLLATGLLLGACRSAAGATAEPSATPGIAATGTGVSLVARETPSAAAPDLNRADEAMLKLMPILIQRTRHFRGDPQAPVTMIEFSDFQCEYCVQFAGETWPQIDEAYVKKGIVRIGYLHFVYLGPDSELAAQASECAGDQDAFWPFHDRLYASQAGPDAQSLDRSRLKQLAGEFKLDQAAFDACLDTGKYAYEVRKETAGGQSLGVRGAPFFLINGRVLPGALPFRVFKYTIEEALKS